MHECASPCSPSLSPTHLLALQSSVFTLSRCLPTGSIHAAFMEFPVYSWWKLHRRKVAKQSIFRPGSTHTMCNVARQALFNAPRGSRRGDLHRYRSIPFKRDYAVESYEVDSDDGNCTYSVSWSFARPAHPSHPESIFTLMVVPRKSGVHQSLPTLMCATLALADPSACLHEPHIQTRRKYMASVMRCVC